MVYVLHANALSPKSLHYFQKILFCYIFDFPDFHVDWLAGWWWCVAVVVGRWL